MPCSFLSSRAPLHIFHIDVGASRACTRSASLAIKVVRSSTNLVELASVIFLRVQDRTGTNPTLAAPEISLRLVPRLPMTLATYVVQ